MGTEGRCDVLVFGYVRQACFLENMDPAAGDRSGFAVFFEEQKGLSVDDLLLMRRTSTMRVIKCHKGVRWMPWR